MNPLISIIVPCYNQAQYLSEALQSVLEQSYTNWECIIVNDGSPDNTHQVAKEWLVKDSRFKYIQKNNGGLSSARNFGINNSLGKFILPLDADDKINSRFLEEMSKYFETDFDLLNPTLVKFGDINKTFKNESYHYNLLIRYNLFPCSCIFTKTAFSNINGYDENLKNGFEDWDFWLRLLQSNSKVVYVKKAAFYYRIKKQSMLKTLQTKTASIDQLKESFYIKNKKKWDVTSEAKLFYTYKNLEWQQNNLERYLSYKQLFKVFVLKIKYSINKVIS